jgi:hypothetical protein
MFLFGTPPAEAIFGIRAARNVIAARKAKQALTETSDPQTEKAMQELEILKRKSALDPRET